MLPKTYMPSFFSTRSGSIIDDIINTILTTGTLFPLTQSYSLESPDSCRQNGWMGVLDNESVPGTSSTEKEKVSTILIVCHERSSIDLIPLEHFRMCCIPPTRGYYKELLRTSDDFV